MIERLLAPESIAIVGASPGRGRGARTQENLTRYDFPGRLYAVNPKYREVLGIQCYPSLDALPEIVDCAIIVVPADPAIEIVEQCARLQIGGAIVFASGFAEAGVDGGGRQWALAQLAHAGGIALCGPNCIGLINVGARTAAFSPPLPFMPAGGNVALVAQSGGILLEVLTPLLEREVGFTHIIAGGNEAVTTLEDYLDHLIGQPHVEVLAAIVESFKQPAAFLDVARRAAALGKPLIILKLGRSEPGRRAAASHTGSLAEDDRVVDAVFRRCGVTRVHSTDHFVETVVLFARRQWPASRGVAIISTSGGRCTLLGDLASEIGLDLAEFSEATRGDLRKLLPPFGSINNPLDPTGVVFDHDGVYGPILSSVARDPSVGLLAAYQLTRNINLSQAEQRTHRSVALARELVAAARTTDKPVVAFTTVAGGTADPQVLDTLAEGGVPLLRGVESALQAVRSAIEHAAYRQRPQPAPPVAAGHRSPPEAQALADRIARDGALSEHWSKRLLASYGISVPEGGLASTREEATHLADVVGYPVAMKAVSPHLSHKTELGLVRLGVASTSELHRAFEALWGAATAHHRPHRNGALEGILVEHMATPGVEVILGARRTAFGPVVMFGAGGVLAELVQDTSLCLAPVFEDDALRMIGETRVAKLLEGYRGREPLDRAAVAKALTNLSRLILDFAEVITEIDVNPLVVTATGVIAVDALVTGRTGDERE